MPAAQHMSAQQQFESIRADVEAEKAERAAWSRARVAAWFCVNSSAFSISMSVLIVVNMAFVIMEVNWNASGFETPLWVTCINFGILFMYFCEVSLKVFAYRRKFCHDILRMIDLFVVSVDIIVTLIILVMPVTLLPLVLARIARMLKVTRALRMMSIFPELSVLMKGMFLALKTIFWGVLLLAVLLCFWSIFATLFVHPIVQDLERQGFWESLDCERCPRAFSSVEMSMLTFCQQLVVGEGWSEINTPLIEKRPEMAIFFVSVLVSLMLAALNVLLGTIVERAAEAKAATERDVAMKKERERIEAGTRLFKICEQLDRDGSGKLTLDELMHGHGENSEFADLLHMMDIGERDLDVVFGLLDNDGSGDVDYREFVEQLHVIKSQEARTMLVFIRYYVMEMRAMLNESLARTGASALHKTKSSLSRKASSRTQEGGAPPEALSLVGSSRADLEAEIKRLADLRQEALDFSELQAGVLHSVHTRLENVLRESVGHVASCQESARCDLPRERMVAGGDQQAQASGCHERAVEADGTDRQQPLSPTMSGRQRSFRIELGAGTWSSDGSPGSQSGTRSLRSM